MAIYRYNVSFMMLTYFLPMAIMIGMYSAIGLELWGQQAIGEATAVQADSIKSKRRVNTDLYYTFFDDLDTYLYSFTTGCQNDGNGGNYLWSLLATLPYLLYCLQCSPSHQPFSLHPSKHFFSNHYILYLLLCHYCQGRLLHKRSPSLMFRGMMSKEKKKFFISL